MVATRIVALLLLLTPSLLAAKPRWQIDRWRGERTAEPPWMTMHDIEFFTPQRNATELPLGSASWQGLDPLFAERIRRAFERARQQGLEPALTSAWRPRWHNEVIGWRREVTGGGTVVPPGYFSPHIGGRAVDIFITQWERIDEWIDILRSEGLFIPIKGDNVHVEALPSRLGEVPGASTLLIDLLRGTYDSTLESGWLCSLQFCGNSKNRNVRFDYFRPLRPPAPPISVEAARVLSEYRAKAEKDAAKRQLELERQEKLKEAERRMLELQRQRELERKLKELMGTSDERQAGSRTRPTPNPDYDWYYICVGDCNDPYYFSRPRNGS